MAKFFTWLIICLSCFKLQAQIRPAENDSLNYILTGFVVNKKTGADTYIFEVAKGYITTEVDFSKKISTSHSANDSQTIILLPSFGNSYTWRVRYTGKKNKPAGKTPLYHFYTRPHPFADTAQYRVRVLNKATSHQNLLLFFDNTRTLRDITGKAVWYLPDIPGVLKEMESVRDLKVTPFGTITFIAISRAYEVDYAGKILWQAPDDGRVSNDTSEYYHHEFTRNATGYFIAGIEHAYSKIPAGLDSNIYKGEPITYKDGQPYLRIPLGTIIQYDSAKNILWSWKSSDYFKEDDLFGRRTPGDKLFTATHQNSFYVDESKMVVYTSFRDVNRIVKIDYPSGVILAAYGAPSTNLFFGQHSCRVNSEGNLYLFNNNVTVRQSLTSASPGHTSNILVLKELPGDSLQTTWKFSCDIDSFATAGAVGGGGVYELNDRSMLVCMGSVNRDFIVNRDKKIVWNVLTEYKNQYTGLWAPQDNYRISPLETTNDLVRLIFK